MSIAEKTKRLLLSKCGGYCMNPSCNKNLFQLFESGKINSIEELAHVIARSTKGPRGKGKLTDRDNYDNIIILCPNCHAEIDKNAEEYSTDKIYTWKKEHIAKIDSQFNVCIYKTRIELRDKIEEYLQENRKIFETYGPHSKEALKNPNSDYNKQWEKLSIEKIIPNNRAIVEFLKSNSQHLSNEEKDLLEEFKLHISDFEMNKIGETKLSNPKTFPEGFENIAKDE